MNQLNESTEAFAPLAGRRSVCLTTFRHDGEPVTTIQSFARYEDRLYIMVPATADVVRRIHANAQVEVTPCNQQGDPLGSPLEAMAIVLPDDQQDAARHALNRKYGWRNRVSSLIDGLHGVRCVCIEITPM